MDTSKMFIIIFYANQPDHQASLKDILTAYSNYDPEVGYT